MELKFEIAGRIARPVEEVFEAVVDPDQLSQFFTTGGARGRLAPGVTVTWDFHDFPGAFPVHVVEVEPNRKIVLRWGAADAAGGKDETVPYETTVNITFEALDDGRTLVRIAEWGWQETAAGLKASYGNCEGWTGMLCAMRVWLEHGIRFRQGFYK